MEVLLRKLQADDAEVVKGIEERCGLSPWTIADYRAEADRADTLSFVAMVNGIASGFIVSRFNSPDCEIHNIAVLPERRRTGIGTSLIEAIIDAVSLRAGRTILLEVRQSSEAARAFYAGFGFVETGLRKGFYANPTEDAVLMQRIAE